MIYNKLLFYSTQISLFLINYRLVTFLLYILYIYIFVQKIQMSKTIQDYREIVKVLKLQLLKVRQENNTLSKNLGISSQPQTSSFTPRLQKFKSSKIEFSKFCYIFNLFAHKCQLIGVTPQMIFRITDKKRDKKVKSDDLNQVMRRLKLKLDSDQIKRLLRLISKSDNIGYDQYLQYINAFQINSQKYPINGQRSYSQICLLKFGQQLKNNNPDISTDKIYRDINNRQETSRIIKFQDFSDFCKKTKLRDVQIIGAFIALDTQSECVIDKDIFTREINKVLDLIERGVKIDQTYKQVQQAEQHDKYDQQIGQSKKKRNDDFMIEQQTGVQQGNKKKKQAKKQPKKIIGKDIVELSKKMKKQGIPSGDFILKLLQKQQQRKLVRPFSLFDFQKILLQLNKSIDKKKIKQFFKVLDSSNNGSVSTDQLIKLWIDGREPAQSSKTLRRLLARHLKQIQSDDFIGKFAMSGYKKQQNVDLSMLQNVFVGLDLGTDYFKLVEDTLIPNKAKISVQKFVQALQDKGESNSKKVFTQMTKKQYQALNKKVSSLVPNKTTKYLKRMRLQAPGQQSQKQPQYWQTIFTNQWECWSACLQIASKLKTFWRDPQFGPNQGDKSGYRSIVGNQSQVPPGLPAQDEIIWRSFQQILQKQDKDPKSVRLFSQNLQANDIVQGKIGDCWFVSSLAIITSNDQYIKGKNDKQCRVDPTNLTYGVHPKMFHIFQKYGLYVFKFFKSFKPVYVICDQLFPVQISSNQLIFARSPDAGLQWVAFVQKAYAKLHHCYSNMISGDIAQGISDLTNTLPIKQDISKANQNPQLQTNLLNKMVKLFQQNQLMGCSINAPPKKGAGAAEQPVLLDGERTGLFSGHAYSIGDLITIRSKQQEDLRDKKNFNLLRIRNPWGHGQWILDWSQKPANDDEDYMKLKKYIKDIDEFYQNKIKDARKMKLNADQIKKYQQKQDGQFVMNFYDFAKLFSNLFTGYNLIKNPYFCQSYQGKWDKATPSGICKAKGATDKQRQKFVKDNYQFVFEIKQKQGVDIIMFLIQEDGRLWRGQKYPYKQVCNGMLILSFTLAEQKTLKMFDKDKMTVQNLKFELKRQVNLWNRFKPGRYAIVPCKLQNNIKQTDFQLRIYSQKRINITKVNGTGPSQFKQISQNVKVQTSSAMAGMIDQLAVSK